jgi:hypothetical protein
LEDEINKELANLLEKKNTNNFLERKPERKRPLRRHRHRCYISIKMDFKEKIEGVDWIHLVEKRQQ